MTDSYCDMHRDKIFRACQNFEEAREKLIAEHRESIIEEELSRWRLFKLTREKIIERQSADIWSPYSMSMFIWSIEAREVAALKFTAAKSDSEFLQVSTRHMAILRNHMS
jgi:hypothetical protein